MQLTGEVDVTANIRAELARRRISHRAAAIELDVTQSSFARRMAGKVEFSASEVRKIADMLGVAVGSLYSEDLSA